MTFIPARVPLPISYPRDVYKRQGIGGTFLLPVSVDGQQTLHLLYHDDIGILVYNLHQFMAELFTSLLTADLYFHTRFQGKIVLCSDCLLYTSRCV